MAPERADLDESLSIAQLAERTGVKEGTLRMWEQRHSFPVPRRLEGGHRRYSESDVELVQGVLQEREAGVSMGAAVQRVLTAHARPADSIFAGVRRRRPGLEPRLIGKRALVAIAHAIEDECLARGEHPLLVASFQRERFYRQAEARWRTLAASAAVSVVFADFPAVREPREGPAELPIDRADPLSREWTIVCRGREFGVALSAWERPANRRERGERLFETLWSVEHDFVEEAALIAADLAAKSSPTIAGRITESLQSSPTRAGSIDGLVALTNRMLAYVTDSQRKA